MYGSDVNAGAVAVIKDGEVVETIPGLGWPHGLVIDSDGTLYASDTTNRTVMKISPTD